MKFFFGMQIVTALLLSVICRGSLQADDRDPLYPNRSILVQLTSQIPTADIIEVDIISKSDVVAMNSKVEVKKTKLVPSDHVDLFSHLWRSQQWNYRNHSAIDDPHYRIRFYRQKSLLLEATLMRSSELWDVRFLRSNLQIKIPTPPEAMFDPKTKMGNQLTTFLEKLIE